MEVTQNIRKLIFDKANQDIIRDEAVKDGMSTLHKEAVKKMKLGLTSIREVIKLTISD